MNQTQEKTAPEKTSDDDVLVTHLVCTGCQGPTRPGVEALCGHVITLVKIPKNRPRQRCVVCADLYRPHMESHQ